MGKIQIHSRLLGLILEQAELKNTSLLSREHVASPHAVILIFSNIFAAESNNLI